MNSFKITSAIEVEITVHHNLRPSAELTSLNEYCFRLKNVSISRSKALPCRGLLSELLWLIPLPRTVVMNRSEALWDLPCVLSPFVAYCALLVKCKSWQVLFTEQLTITYRHIRLSFCVCTIHFHIYTLSLSNLVRQYIGTIKNAMHPCVFDTRLYSPRISLFATICYLKSKIVFFFYLFHYTSNVV